MVIEMLIPNTNEPIDYADLFDPGEGKQAFKDYGRQRTGSLYAPETEKWLNRDCPLCHEPFAVKRCQPFAVKRYKSEPYEYRAVWLCTKCHRKIMN